MAAELRSGTVIDFDEHVGLGVVRATDGDDFPFHCTQIADGSRTIPVGSSVAFIVVPAHKGRYEASQLVITIQ